MKTATDTMCMVKMFTETLSAILVRVTAGGKTVRGAQGSVRVTSPASLLRPLDLVAEATSGRGT